MSISELNQFMTYVIEGWMLFSTGLTGIMFVSFVSRRIQEDMEAAALAQSLDQSLTQAEAVSETVSTAVVEAEAVPVAETMMEKVDAIAPIPDPYAPIPNPYTVEPKTHDETGHDETAEIDEVDLEAAEAARLEEIAAVSEKLAQEKQKQSGSSSVSVST